jgi:hypothetical protein
VTVAEPLEPFAGEGRIDRSLFGARRRRFGVLPVRLVTFVVLFQFH